MFKPKGFRWSVPIIIVALALLSISMEAIILWDFQLSFQADINIGVLSAICSTTPLTISVVEYFSEGIKPGKVNLLGFLCLVLGSISVSFSVEADNYFFGGKDV